MTIRNTSAKLPQKLHYGVQKLYQFVFLLQKKNIELIEKLKIS